ncbi:MAG: hypothetical protein CVU87_02265 [Firmicutes bacterium HGW-Firmicutes-12]|jgi:lipoprotein-releasing system permease protein|nr:MAG: hypothetical protein CVU87_02265 [Firmicutes bacterium HGW-Firmicutes-12]
MSFDFFLAWRFLKEAKTQTLLTLLAITIGVGVQIFLASLITGLQFSLLDATVGSSSHINITSELAIPTSILNSSQPTDDLISSQVSYIKRDRDLSNWQPIIEELSNYSEISAISPLVNGSSFLQKGTVNRPIQIKGIDPPSADKIYKYRDNIILGTSSISGNDILLGRELSEDLNLTIGDSIQITTPQGSQAIFSINGIFDLGVKGLNTTWVLMDISRAQNLLQKKGDISVIEIQISDVFSSETIAKDLRTKWPELKIETWQSSNKQLLSGLKSQSSSSLVIQFFVQLAVLLGISSVLAISVVQKSKLIGILKAMGLKNYRVGRIFLLQGLLLGLLGSITGCLVGYGLIRTFLYATSISGAEISFVITTTPLSYLSSITVATLASILAAFLPARRASSFNPIEVIRNG